MTEKNIFQTRIREKLTARFQPIHLEIKDDSAKHAGHAGHSPLGETHFSVFIVSDSFDGLSPVARHKLVYESLSDELNERIHALSLKVKSSKEYN